MVESAALNTGFLRFTPITVLNLWARSTLVGLSIAAGIGLPTLLLVWAIVGSGEVPGLSWVVFKTIWPAFVALPIIAATYLSAIDERHFFELVLSDAAVGYSPVRAGVDLEERLVMLDASVNG